MSVFTFKRIIPHYQSCSSLSPEADLKQLRAGGFRSSPLPTSVDLRFADGAERERPSPSIPLAGGAGSIGKPQPLSGVRSADWKVSVADEQI